MGLSRRDRRMAERRDLGSGAIQRLPTECEDDGRNRRGERDGAEIIRGPPPPPPRRADILRQAVCGPSPLYERAPHHRECCKTLARARVDQGMPLEDVLIVASAQDAGRGYGA